MSDKPSLKMDTTIVRLQLRKPSTQFNLAYLRFLQVPFTPRMPFHRGGRRPPHFFPRNRGSRPPGPGKYRERGALSPSPSHSPAPAPSPAPSPVRTATPRPPAPVTNLPQPSPFNCSELVEALNSPYSCSELLDALRSLQCAARCGSCRQPLRSARTCAAGHGLCWGCKQRCGRVCPVCGGAVPDGKPVLLNDIVKLLPRVCRYAQQGCDSVVLAGDVRHETHCRHRRVVCRVPGCGAACLARDLLRHLQDRHAPGLILQPQHSSILMDFDARIEKDGLAVIVAYNNIIWQHTRSGHNRLLQFYQYVPMERPRARFSAEVEFHTPEVSFAATTPVHTDVFDPSQLFKDKETFCLPQTVAASFNRFYGGVNYSFKIIKEDL